MTFIYSLKFPKHSIPKATLVLIFFIGFLALTPSSSFAYDGKSDTNEIFIRKFHEFWYLKALSMTKEFSMQFTDENVQTEDMTIRPFAGNYLGFGFFLFDVGIDFVFRTPPNEIEKELYGSSKARDYQVHLYTRQVGIDVSYQDYTGFYLENPKNFYPDWESGDPYPRSEQTKASGISFSGVYVFNNHKYSFPSVFNHTEAQLKSAGSFILTGQMKFSRISDPVSIIPKTDTNNFTSLTNLTNVNSNSFNILPGYTHNFIIFKKFYISAALSLGLGYQIRNYTANDESYQNNDIGIANTWRLGGGYNGRRFFTGITYYTEKNEVKIQSLKIASQNGFVRFFMGYRFREWGFMRKSVFDIFKPRNRD